MAGLAGRRQIVRSCRDEAHLDWRAPDSAHKGCRRAGTRSLLMRMLNPDSTAEPASGRVGPPDNTDAWNASDF
jgi:hypothetical protein